jgi:hypothetical protein
MDHGTREISGGIAVIRGRGIDVDLMRNTKTKGIEHGRRNGSIGDPRRGLSKSASTPPSSTASL